MIFIDAGAFLGRFLPDDYNHKSAVVFWKMIEDAGEPCFTSNFIVNEWLTLLARRKGYKIAAERAKNFYVSQVFEVLRPALEEEWQAIALFDKFADQNVSFTDCTSFVLMRQRKIQRVFSFDRHFTLAGFRVHP